MSEWKPVLNSQDAARLSKLEESIRKIRGAIEAKEIKAAKLTSDSVLKARKVGLILNKIKTLLGKQYTAWVESDRFNGSLSTAKGYRKLTRPEIWEKVKQALHSEEGCTYKQAMQIAVKNPQPKLATRQQELAKKLTQKFARMVNSWPEAPLARLGSDVRFMRRIEEVARERNKAVLKTVKAQLLHVA